MEKEALKENGRVKQSTGQIVKSISLSYLSAFSHSQEEPPTKRGVRQEVKTKQTANYVTES